MNTKKLVGLHYCTSKKNHVKFSDDSDKSAGKIHGLHAYAFINMFSLALNFIVSQTIYILITKYV
ncbi:hypothetical protein T11_1529 [Trichinella zimbabwensis]|uniref:Uncharacterized protein n=1 Tax=Trichinella zimbabwensis TaxID=268475 RepID=A0A0V1HB10_9BILA|nr:hypothetical protein T11_1529 [Trichinella zimbabwensis]